MARLLDVLPLGLRRLLVSSLGRPILTPTAARRRRLSPSRRGSTRCSAAASCALHCTRATRRAPRRASARGARGRVAAASGPPMCLHFRVQSLSAYTIVEEDFSDVRERKDLFDIPDPIGS